MNTKKGQAALEFLMNYGWAFLMILALGGALYYYGVIDPTKFVPEKLAMVGDLQSAGGYSLTYSSIDGSRLLLDLANPKEEPLKITKIAIKTAKSSNYTEVELTQPLTILPGSKEKLDVKEINDLIDDSYIDKKEKFDIKIFYTVGTSNIPKVQEAELTTVIIEQEFPDHCTNDVFDSGSETDTDCGIECAGCDKDKNCTSNDDCKSVYECYQNKCKERVLGSCSDDTDCGADLKCSDSKCRYIDDHSCTSNDQCMNVCINSNCGAVSSLNDACDENADCDTDLSCSNNVCKYDNGHSCSSNDECVNTCINGNCADVSSLNGACDDNDNNDCASGLECSNNICLKQNEQNCNNNNECASGHCVGGICSSTGQELCNNDQDDDGDGDIDCEDSDCVGETNSEGKTCCSNDNDCSSNFNCVSNICVDLDMDKDVCQSLGFVWIDDGSAFKDGTVANCCGDDDAETFFHDHCVDLDKDEDVCQSLGFVWIKDESAFEDGTVANCCGDDNNEYSKKDSSSGNYGCCNDNTKIFNGVECRTLSGPPPGGLGG